MAEVNQELLKAIREVIELKQPCEESETEILCDDCPYDIRSDVDCGLALIQERAKVRLLEMNA